MYKCNTLYINNDDFGFDLGDDFYINDDGLHINIYCTTLTMQLLNVNNKVKYFTCF